MSLFNIIYDNSNIMFYSVFIGTASLLTVLFIKSYLVSTNIETPNSPPTFNFSQEQLNEVQAILDRGDQLDQETQDLLDQDLQTIMGEDLYNEMQADLQALDVEFANQLQDLFNNSLLNIHCPLELIDITNLIPISYHALGFLIVLKIFFWAVNLICSTYNNIWIKIIQVISILNIIAIILLSINILYDNIYNLAYLIPFSTNTKFKTEINTRSMSMSIDRITYLDDFIKYDVCIFNDCHFRFLEFSDNLEIKNFLSELIKNRIYVVNLEFVYSVLIYNENSPTINLSKPILIVKNSNPDILSKFIHERINNCIETFYLDDSLFYTGNKNDRPAVIIKFNEINIF